MYLQNIKITANPLENKKNHDCQMAKKIKVSIKAVDYI